MPFSDPLQDLHGKRVLVYFSAGRPTPAQRSLPYDRLVFVNHSLRDKVDSRVIQVGCDNNEAILRMFYAGVRVHCVVGVNDGCCEGGNYECINTATFFGRVAPILHDDCLYVADHRSRWYAPFFGIRFWPTHFEAEAERNDPQGLASAFRPSASPTTRVWRLRRRDPHEVSARVGDTQVAVRHASVFEDLLTDRLDGSFVPFMRVMRESWAQHAYAAWPTSRMRPLEPYVGKSIRGLLEEARVQGWRHIGVCPIGPGRYEAALDEIRRASGSPLESITFYHLHPTDMPDLRMALSPEEPRFPMPPRRTFAEGASRTPGPWALEDRSRQPSDPGTEALRQRIGWLVSSLAFRLLERLPLSRWHAIDNGYYERLAHEWICAHLPLLEDHLGDGTRESRRELDDALWADFFRWAQERDPGLLDEPIDLPWW